jgi:hypothetical protein
MFSEEILNKDYLFSQSLPRRVLHSEINLDCEVVPRGVAQDWNDIPAFLPVQKIETGRDERDKQNHAEN